MIIILEGIDGAGKTSLARSLHEKFIQNDIPSDFISFPSNSEVGKLSNRLLSEEIDGINENHRFCVSISDMINELYKKDGIINKSKNGQFVICDRFFTSTEVYQSVICQEIMQAAKEIIFYDCFDILIFFLDVSPEEAEKRRKNRTNAELYENTSKLKKVYKTYKEKISEYSRDMCFIISEKNSIKENVDKIYEVCMSKANW